MNDNIMSAADMMARIFDSGIGQKIKAANKIDMAWQSTVSKINGDGEMLVAHSSVADLKNGVLTVECDHNVWAQLLQLYSKFILNGLSFTLPDIEVKSIFFRIKDKERY